MVCMLYEAHHLRANINSEVGVPTDAFVKYLDKSLQTPHSIFVSSLHIWPHFVFVFVFAKQIQADPLSILAASRYIQSHFCICICICKTNPSRSTQYSGCLALYPATLVAHQSHCQRATPTKAPLNTCCLGFHQNITKNTSKIPSSHRYIQNTNSGSLEVQ